MPQFPVNEVVRHVPRLEIVEDVRNMFNIEMQVVEKVVEVPQVFVQYWFYMSIGVLFLGVVAVCLQMLGLGLILVTMFMGMLFMGCFEVFLEQFFFGMIFEWWTPS